MDTLRLTLRIIATAFMGLSMVTSFLKNMTLFDDKLSDLILFQSYGMIWRTFIIVSIWVI